VRWAGRVEITGEMRKAYKVWSEILNGRVHLKVLGTDVNITVTWIREMERD
jgi:hypothetical protein